MTAAERLLAAADLLDKRAGAATEGPWTVPTGPRYVFLDGFSGHDVDGPKGGFVARGTCWADATYIATVHPEVGKAVAAWLRAEANRVVNGPRAFGGRALFTISPEAASVADLILAGAS